MKITSIKQLNNMLSVDPDSRSAQEYKESQNIVATCEKCGAHQVNDETYRVHHGPAMSNKKLCARVCRLIKPEDKAQCLNKDTVLTPKEQEALSFKPLGTISLDEYN